MSAETIQWPSIRDFVYGDSDKRAPRGSEFGIDAGTGHRQNVLLWLTMITGRRRGEVSALRRSSVDLERAQLIVGPKQYAGSVAHDPAEPLNLG